MSRRTVAMAAKAGIQYLFTSEPTLAPWQCAGITCLGRVCIMQDESLAAIERLIRLKGYGRRRVIRLSKQLIKKLIRRVYHFPACGHHSPSPAQPRLQGKTAEPETQYRPCLS